MDPLFAIAVIGAAVLFWKNRNTTAVPTAGPRPSGIMWMQPPITSPPLMLPPSFGTATCVAIHCDTAVSTVPVVPKPAVQQQPKPTTPAVMPCTEARAIRRPGSCCTPLEPLL